jgi:hypothetical protein
LCFAPSVKSATHSEPSTTREAHCLWGHAGPLKHSCGQTDNCSEFLVRHQKQNNAYSTVYAHWRCVVLPTCTRHHVACVAMTSSENRNSVPAPDLGTADINPFLCVSVVKYLHYESITRPLSTCLGLQGRLTNFFGVSTVSLNTKTPRAYSMRDIISTSRKRAKFAFAVPISRSPSLDLLFLPTDLDLVTPGQAPRSLSASRRDRPACCCTTQH